MLWQVPFFKIARMLVTILLLANLTQDATLGNGEQPHSTKLQPV